MSHDVCGYNCDAWISSDSHPMIFRLMLVNELRVNASLIRIRVRRCYDIFRPHNTYTESGYQYIQIIRYSHQTPDIRSFGAVCLCRVCVYIKMMCPYSEHRIAQCINKYIAIHFTCCSRNIVRFILLLHLYFFFHILLRFSSLSLFSNYSLHSFFGPIDSSTSAYVCLSSVSIHHSVFSLSLFVGCEWRSSAMYAPLTFNVLNVIVTMSLHEFHIRSGEEWKIICSVISWKTI